MIGSTRQLRVFAYAEPVDMRKGFDGLSALAQSQSHDVMEGDLLLFIAKRRKRAKVLFWDGTGLVVYSKRLEKGRFTAPWERGERPLEMTVSELALFLEGSHLAGRIRLSPSEFILGSSNVFTQAQNRR